MRYSGNKYFKELYLVQGFIQLDLMRQIFEDQQLVLDAFENHVIGRYREEILI